MADLLRLFEDDPQLDCFCDGRDRTHASRVFNAVRSLLEPFWYTGNASDRLRDQEIFEAMEATDNREIFSVELGSTNDGRRWARATVMYLASQSVDLEHGLWSLRESCTSATAE
jgi:hypothetical protein